MQRIVEKNLLFPFGAAARSRAAAATAVVSRLHGNSSTPSGSFSRPAPPHFPAGCSRNRRIYERFAAGRARRNETSVPTRMLLSDAAAVSCRAFFLAHRFLSVLNVEEKSAGTTSSETSACRSPRGGQSSSKTGGAPAAGTSSSPSRKVGERNGRRGGKKKRAVLLGEPSKASMTGLQKPCRISGALEVFLGKTEASRVDVTRAIWKYIKSNNLQDPNNKRIILCDTKLREVFGAAELNMLQMPKALNKYIHPLPSTSGKSSVGANPVAIGMSSMTDCNNSAAPASASAPRRPTQ